MQPLKVSIFGAGKVGTALAGALAGRQEFTVEVIDCSEDAADRLRALGLPVGVRAYGYRDELPGLLAGCDVVVAAVPEAARPGIAVAAVQAGAHYLDFSPARDRMKEILEPLAQHKAVMMGCGVSPGVIDNVANGLVETLSTVSDLTIRVGAIPRFPTNRLGYGQIWNVGSLIDEYTLPSAAVRDGQAVTIAPLEEYERIRIDGVTYEGFVTSGGLEDLTLLAEAGPRNITFKTLRYPGHLDYMRFLLDDLGLRNRRDMLRTLLMNGLPEIAADVLVLAVTAKGVRNGNACEKTVVHRFQPRVEDSPFNALSSVAAGYAASLLSGLKSGKIAETGFSAHHRLKTSELLAGEFLNPLLQG
jgi:saccharopine dehydrogenase-like NADP-dependent oxidoreductase